MPPDTLSLSDTWGHWHPRASILPNCTPNTIENGDAFAVLIHFYASDCAESKGCSGPDGIACRSGWGRRADATPGASGSDGKFSHRMRKGIGSRVDTYGDKANLRFASLGTVLRRDRMSSPAKRVVAGIIAPFKASPSRWRSWRGLTGRCADNYNRQIASRSQRSKAWSGAVLSVWKTPMTRPRRPRGPSVQSPLETYLREINETALLTADEEKILAHRIEDGDSEARDRMVRANLRLVVNIARSYTGKGLGLQDLIEEGNLGLLRAVEGFDPDDEHALQHLRQLLDQAVDQAGPGQHRQDDPHPRLHGRTARQVAAGHRQAAGRTRPAADPGRSRQEPRTCPRRS